MIHALRETNCGDVESREYDEAHLDYVALKLSQFGQS